MQFRHPNPTKTVPARTGFAKPGWVAIGAALLVSACGAGLSSGGLETGTLAGQPRPEGLQQDGRYLLSNEEQALDCRRLTGRMQVRILQVRDRQQPQRSSVASMLRGVFASDSPTGTVLDADKANTLDRAMLTAYNASLREKRCMSFDLDQDLSRQAVGEMPRPRISAPTK